MKTIEVPIQLIEGELGSARFQVAVEIDEKSELLQIDTGCTYTSLQFNTTSSKYAVVGSRERTSASGKPKTSELIEIAKLQIGPVIKSNFRVVRCEHGSSEISRLGMDALMAPDLTFDLKSMKLFMANDGASTEKNRLHRYVGGTFGIDIVLGSQTVEALWDTGAELSVINRDFVSAHPGYFEFKQSITNGVDAAGNKVQFDLYYCPVMKIGDSTVSGDVMTMDFGMINAKVAPNIKVILGTNLIRNYIWHFDFTNARWSLDRS